jgi:hypothetical protein
MRFTFNGESMSDDLNKIADEIIQLWKKKLNNAKSENANWGKTINVIFPDIETGYAIKFLLDGSVEIEKKPASECKVEGDVVVNAIGNVLDVKEISDGNMSPYEAEFGAMIRYEGPFFLHGVHLTPCFPIPNITG